MTESQSVERHPHQHGTFTPFSPIRTMTVGPGISPDLLTHPEGWRSRAITAGGEFHPALRMAFCYGSFPVMSIKTASPHRATHSPIATEPPPPVR